MLISGRSNNLNYYNLVRFQYDSRMEILALICSCIAHDYRSRRKDYARSSPEGTPADHPSLGADLACFFVVWCFLGAYLALKTGLKIDASGPNRLEIEFPFDLNLWHQFSRRF